jgi:4-aminobutyrate aminotransferase
MTKYTRPEIKTAMPGPNAKRVIEQDKAYMTSSTARDYPFVISHGEGSLGMGCGRQPLPRP